MYRQIVGEYFDKSTLHGLKYISDLKRNIIERSKSPISICLTYVELIFLFRWFWTICCIVSLLYTGKMMTNLLQAIRMNQIIIYSDENFIRVIDINFPSVSFCPSLNLEMGRKFNYEQTIDDLVAGRTKLENLTQDQ